MSEALRRRLRALEMPHGPRWGGVVVAMPGETYADAAQRANRGSVIVMPLVAMDPDEWERETTAGQRRLLSRAAVVAACGLDPGA